MPGAASLRLHLSECLPGLTEPAILLGILDAGVVLVEPECADIAVLAQAPAARIREIVRDGGAQVLVVLNPADREASAAQVVSLLTAGAERMLIGASIPEIAARICALARRLASLAAGRARIAPTGAGPSNPGREPDGPSHDLARSARRGYGGRSRHGHLRFRRLALGSGWQG